MRHGLAVPEESRRNPGVGAGLPGGVQGSLLTQRSREHNWRPKAMLRRFLALIYGGVCYAAFLAVAVYGAGFIVGLATPTKLDGMPARPLSQALLIDLGLLAVFALQHSGMARPTFKRWWTRIVPEAAERSTYVLLSSLAVGAFFAFWQPVGGVIWQSEGTTRALIIGVYLF